MVLGRGAIIVVSSFGAQAFLALLTEVAAAPLGCLIDAAVIASATDEVRVWMQLQLWGSKGLGQRRRVRPTVQFWCSIAWVGLLPGA